MCPSSIMINLETLVNTLKVGHGVVNQNIICIAGRAEAVKGCVANSMYRIVASSNMSHLEPHPGLFRLLMKWIFDAFVL